MRNADLAEIRARLQAAAEERARPGLFAGLHAAWPRRGPPTALLAPAEPPQSAARATPGPRAAFGQRAETIEAPLHLDAPLPPEPPAEATLLLAEPIVEPPAARRRRARPRGRGRAATMLLMRLERTLLAEQAALDARRI